MNGPNWHTLPDELTLHILSFLDLADLMRVQTLSKAFRALAEDKHCDATVWRRHYHAVWYHGWDYDELGPLEDKPDETRAARIERAEEREKTIIERRKQIRNEMTRYLPRTEELASWKALAKLRMEEESKIIENAKAKPPSQVPHKDRTCAMYIEWGEILRETIPKDHPEDLSHSEEEEQVAKIARTYLICSEEYLSALSFHPEKEELFDCLRLRAGVAHEYALYQRHYRNSRFALREWFGLACELYEVACGLAEKADLSAMFCNWAGALRDYASCGVHDERKTDELFESAYAKFEAATNEFVGILLDHLFVENWAYALKEHANLKLKQKKYKEADRLFEECYQKYAHCVALTEDSVVLSNWADALREQAEVKKGEEQQRIFDVADTKYQASFHLDPTDCLTICNWAMLLVSRARKERKKQVLPENDVVEAIEAETTGAGEKEKEKEKGKDGVWEKEMEKEMAKEEQDGGPRKEWGARAMEKIVAWLEKEYEGAESGLPHQFTLQQTDDSDPQQDAWKAIFVIDRDRGEIRKLSDTLGQSNNTNTATVSVNTPPTTTPTTTTTTPSTTTATPTTTTTTTTTTRTVPTTSEQDQVAESENEYHRLLKVAEQKLAYCLEKNDTWSYFCMARLCAVAERYEECKQWLEKCADRPFLKRAKDTQMADFENVMNMEWFQQLLQSEEKPM